jgi:hypothetical protein
MAEIIACPEPTCRAPAEVVDQWVLRSTSGPVAHLKTWCLNGHWFTPTVDSLTPDADAAWRAFTTGA